MDGKEGGRRSTLNVKLTTIAIGCWGVNGLYNVFDIFFD